MLFLHHIRALVLAAPLISAANRVTVCRRFGVSWHLRRCGWAIGKGGFGSRGMKHKRLWIQVAAVKGPGGRVPCRDRLRRIPQVGQKPDSQRRFTKPDAICHAKSMQCIPERKKTPPMAIELNRQSQTISNLPVTVECDFCNSVTPRNKRKTCGHALDSKTQHLLKGFRFTIKIELCINNWTK